MGADDGAIDDQVFHIRVLDEMLMHPLPYSFFTPTGKTLVDAVPVAVAFGKQSPGRSATRHPQDGFHELAATLFPSNVEVGTGTKKLQELGPLIVGYFNG